MFVDHVHLQAHFLFGAVVAEFTAERPFATTFIRLVFGEVSFPFVSLVAGFALKLVCLVRVVSWKKR